MSTTVAAVTPVVASGNTGGNAGVVSAVRNTRVDFQTLLSAFRAAEVKQPAQPAAAPYTVKSGDTLSGICAAAFRKAGVKASQSDILAAAGRVARANGLPNADRIYIGQALDLSEVQLKPASESAAAVAQGGPSMTAVQWGAAVLSDAVTPSAEPARLQAVVNGARVTSGFGLRKNPFTGAPEYHSGIDLAAAAGSKVYPVQPGKVAFSGWQPGYGKVVIVSHNDGTETLYAHNQSNLAKQGQEVDWGTPIGRVGSTGDSTGPHVHFELRKHGRAVNPADYVQPSIKVAQAL